MIYPEFLHLLRCPVTGEPLELAAADLLACVNQAIKSGRLSNRIGTVLQSELSAALVNRSHTTLYPIVNGAPWLLPDEAIAIVGLVPCRSAFFRS